MSDATFWLLVGLGNPGERYARHRHNLGFLAVETWLSDNDPMAGWRDKWSARTATASMRFARVVVLEPQTYMNNSGRSVVAASGFHKIPPERILVVHDELDFEFGRVAVKAGGGHGGHNGLRDIVEQLGTRDFPRVRIGVGRPPKGRDPTPWLLSDFGPDQLVELPGVLERASEAITTVMTKGLRAAQNLINRTESSAAEPSASSD